MMLNFLVSCYGDFNKVIGDVIPNNNDKVSVGGKLVREFIKSGKYILINSTDKTRNGPFTRYEPKSPNDESTKSALDLVIISKNLERYVEELKIDKDLLFTPFRVKAKSKELVYSDHYALLLSLRNVPRGNSKNQVKNGVRTIVWNTNKKDGWKNYLRETSQNKVLDKISNLNGETTDILFKKINDELINIKHKVFGKVLINKKEKGAHRVNELQNKKHNLDKVYTGDILVEKRDEIDTELKSAMNELQYEAFGKEIKKLKSIKATKGTSAAVFHLRTGVLGSSKLSSDPVIINDPISGVPLLDPVDIKSDRLKYCVTTDKQTAEGSLH